MANAKTKAKKTAKKAKAASTTAKAKKGKKMMPPTKKGRGVAQKPNRKGKGKSKKVSTTVKSDPEVNAEF